MAAGGALDRARVGGVIDHQRYVPWPHPSPLLDALGGFEHDPEDRLRIGFLVDTNKVNARGFLHAGAIAAIADAAIGHSLASGSDRPQGLVTINLSCDLLGTANLGDWVDGTVHPTRNGRRLAAGSILFTTDRPIATVTALFVPTAA
jgi:acyl-coenzyme A thioesterase PaaI-like protein